MFTAELPAQLAAQQQIGQHGVATHTVQPQERLHRLGEERPFRCGDRYDLDGVGGQSSRGAGQLDGHLEVAQLVYQAVLSGLRAGPTRPPATASTSVVERLRPAATRSLNAS